MDNTLAPATPAPRKPVAQGSIEQQQLLTFTLNHELFAIMIMHVKEIIEYGSLTEIPMMPPFIRGVINLRGAVVPVVDLAARFGGQPSEIGKRTCIVIVEIVQEVDGSPLRQDVGVVVDSVNEVLEIPASEIEPPPSFGARIRVDFILGMGKMDGKFVIILDIDRVLSVDEMSQLAAVAAGASA